MVCRLKSISGTGRLLVTARTALSMYFSWLTPWLAMLNNVVALGVVEMSKRCRRRRLAFQSSKNGQQRPSASVADEGWIRITETAETLRHGDEDARWCRG